jgi:hypothetical protein
MKNIQLALLLSSIVCAPLASAASTLSPIADADCQTDYLSLMANPEINVTVAYGYFDVADGTTWDNRILNQFLTTMTSPCKTWHTKSCGFKKTGKGPFVLTRKMTGPDGLIKTVKINVDAPSVSTDNKSNMSNPLQKTKSQTVKDMYLKGLRNSEVTLYLGHSRDGGGPDFDPPRMNGTHVDYDWYHNNPKDKKEMLNVLAENPNKARIVGFFSCSSIRWFSKGVSSGAPASGFIGTDDTYWTSAFDQVYPFIEKIFSYQCVDKLIVADAKKVANIKLEKKWKIPEKDSQITKVSMIQKTLEKLAVQLSSADMEVRKEAYREIQSYETKYYSQNVWKAVNDYKFGNFMGKSLGNL